MFMFVYNDGNNGAEIEFTTIEAAVDAAETKWNYLTEREKVKYADKMAGGLFMILDEDGMMIYDFADEVA